MGILKNDVRRSAKRARGKPPKPSGQAPRTIVPEPEVPAEDSPLDALRGEERDKESQPRRPDANRPRAPGAAPTILPAPEEGVPAGEGGASVQSPALAPAQLEAAVRQNEERAFALHLDAQPTATKPTVPAPDPPDPAPERSRLERELGISELAASLEQYGSPPIARAEDPPDLELLEQQLMREASPHVSRWNVSGRRTLRGQAREEAIRRAQAEAERLAAERIKLQGELDARWAELSSLRERAARELDEWFDKEVSRREAERAEWQAILDREWQQEADADVGSITATLRAAFPHDAVTVIGCLDRVAVLVVACPDMDGVIARKEPAVTSAGRPTMRARTETRRNDLYLSAVASIVLAAVGRALSVTPGITAVTCVAVRAGKAGARAWEPIYVGTFDRAYAQRLVAEGSWSQNTDALARALEEADEVDLDITGRTHQIAALDLSADPGLAAIIAQLDPAIRADEDAARRSDLQALRAFFDDDATPEHDVEARGPEHDVEARGQDTKEHVADDIDNENGGVELADLQGDVNTAVQQPTEADSSGDESKPSGSSDGQAGKQGDVPVRASDPLLDALRDSDGFVRRAAVEVISRRNDPEDTPLLLQALSDPDDYVRLEAMYGLKDRLSPDMRRDALVRACSDADQGVRRKALEALAELGDERDVPLLVKGLKDRDANVRLEAVYAIRSRLSPDVRDALITACSDVDERVRRKAFEAVAQLGDERDTPLLLKGLKDSDSSVRLEAIYALEGRSMLAPSGGFSKHLSEAMKDEDASVRQAAVRLLGRLEQPASSMHSS